MAKRKPMKIQLIIHTHRYGIDFYAFPEDIEITLPMAIKFLGDAYNLDEHERDREYIDIETIPVYPSLKTIA